MTLRTRIISCLFRIALRLMHSHKVADQVHNLLSKDFIYNVYGRCLADFLIKTEIDSEAELDLLLESAYTIKYSPRGSSIRILAAYLDDDFGTTTFTNKVNEVCGTESNNANN